MRVTNSLSSQPLQTTVVPRLIHGTALEQQVVDASRAPTEMGTRTQAAETGPFEGAQLSMEICLAESYRGEGDGTANTTWELPNKSGDVGLISGLPPRQRASRDSGGLVGHDTRSQTNK